jgi:hypothetical protein
LHFVGSIIDFCLADGARRNRLRKLREEEDNAMKKIPVRIPFPGLGENCFPDSSLAGPDHGPCPVRIEKGKERGDSNLFPTKEGKRFPWWLLVFAIILMLILRGCM